MIGPGSQIPPWTVPAVSAESMKLVAALIRDPTPIHWDVQAVRAAGLGDKPVNGGAVNLAYLINMLARWAGGTQNVVDVDVRYVANVFAGDTVTARGSVRSVREDGGQRWAECDVWLERGDGAVCVTGTATVRLPGAGDTPDVG
jgi:acyl dehydratase